CGFEQRYDGVGNVLALPRQHPELAYLAEATDREQDMLRCSLRLDEPEWICSEKPVDGCAGEALVDHPGYQEQDLVPVRIGPAPTEDIPDEFVGCPFASMEPLHDVGRTEILQESAVNKTVHLGAEMAEDKVTLPKLVQHRPCRWLGLHGR